MLLKRREDVKPAMFARGPQAPELKALTGVLVPLGMFP